MSSNVGDGLAAAEEPVLIIGAGESHKEPLAGNPLAYLCDNLRLYGIKYCAGFEKGWLSYLLVF